MDTKLAYPSSLLEVHGAEMPQGRMPAGQIVEAFDIIEHVCLCMRPGAEDRLAHPLGLER